MLAVAGDGSFCAAPDGQTVVRRAHGRTVRRTFADARSIAVRAERAAVLHRDGRVSIVDDGVSTLWSAGALREGAPCAVSPSGAHVFNGERLLRRATEDGSITERELDTLDFFEAFTGARFIDDALLATAYVTSQPYSEQGSYGEPMSALMITRVDGDGDVLIEWSDTRRNFARFEPTAVAFARPASLAMVVDGELSIFTDDEPRSHGWNGRPGFGPDLRDTYLLLESSFARFDRTRRWIAARSGAVCSVLDTRELRRSELAIGHDAFDFHQGFVRWLGDDDELELAPLDALDWRGMYD